jgi:undecaprenyl-diphosphatase
MDYIYSLFLAMVQSLTEFLPVSSSGHLLILHQFIPLRLIDDLSFDVLLHTGTLLSLLVYFRKEVVQLLKAFFQSFSQWNFKQDLNQRLAWLIIIGNLPVIIIGYFFGDYLEATFRSVIYVAIALALVAILFFIVEKTGQKNRQLNALTIKDSLIIGLAQVIALIPGISRSGITIVAGLNQNLKREEAARFSFLLSIPVILGATIQKVHALPFHLLTQQTIVVLFFGLIISAIAGFYAIKFLMVFFRKYSLRPFAIYRLILAVIILFTIFI